MEKKNKILSLFVISILIGLLAGINYKLVSKDNNDINEIKRDNLSLTTELEKVKRTNAELQKVCGLMAISGEGIVVKLQDKVSVFRALENPQKGLVHDEDLLKVVNELWACGAQAISINGNRIVVNSELRCAGPTIILNKERIASPYIIKAIGPSRLLYDSINIRGGYIDYLRQMGIGVLLARESKIIIPAYKGGFDLDNVQEYKKV